MKEYLKISFSTMLIFAAVISVSSSLDKSDVVSVVVTESTLPSSEKETSEKPELSQSKPDHFFSMDPNHLNKTRLSYSRKTRDIVHFHLPNGMNFPAYQETFPVPRITPRFRNSNNNPFIRDRGIRGFHEHLRSPVVFEDSLHEPQRFPELDHARIPLNFIRKPSKRPSRLYLRDPIHTRYQLGGSIPNFDEPIAYDYKSEIGFHRPVKMSPFVNFRHRQVARDKGNAAFPRRVKGGLTNAAILNQNRHVDHSMLQNSDNKAFAVNNGYSIQQKPDVKERIPESSGPVQVVRNIPQSIPQDNNEREFREQSHREKARTPSHNTENFNHPDANGRKPYFKDGDSRNVGDFSASHGGPVQQQPRNIVYPSPNSPHSAKTTKRPNDRNTYQIPGHNKPSLLILNKKIPGSPYSPNLKETSQLISDATSSFDRDQGNNFKTSFVPQPVESVPVEKYGYRREAHPPIVPQKYSNVAPLREKSNTYGNVLKLPNVQPNFQSKRTNKDLLNPPEESNSKDVFYRFPESSTMRPAFDREQPSTTFSDLSLSDSEEDSQRSKYLWDFRTRTWRKSQDVQSTPDPILQGHSSLTETGQLYDLGNPSVLPLAGSSKENILEGVVAPNSSPEIISQAQKSEIPRPENIENVTLVHPQTVGVETDTKLSLTAAYAEPTESTQFVQPLKELEKKIINVDQFEHTPRFLPTVSFHDSVQADSPTITTQVNATVENHGINKDVATEDYYEYYYPTETEPPPTAEIVTEASLTEADPRSLKGNISLNHEYVVPIDNEPSTSMREQTFGLLRLGDKTFGARKFPNKIESKPSEAKLHLPHTMYENHRVIASIEPSDASRYKYEMVLTELPSSPSAATENYHKISEDLETPSTTDELPTVENTPSSELETIEDYYDLKDHKGGEEPSYDLEVTLPVALDAKESVTRVKDASQYTSTLSTDYKYDDYDEAAIVHPEDTDSGNFGPFENNGFSTQSEDITETPSFPTVRVEMKINQSLETSSVLTNYTSVKVGSAPTTITPELMMVDSLTSMKTTMRKVMSKCIRHIMPIVMTLGSGIHVSSDCTFALLRWIRGIRYMEQWAVKMVDASSKIPEGILYGTFSTFGSYDECVAISVPGGNPEHPVKGQYCSVNIRPRLPENERHFTIDDAFQKYPDLRKVFKEMNIDEKAMAYYYILKHRIGLCIPSSCTAHDLENVTSNLAYHLKTNISVDRCETSESNELTTGQIVSIVGIVLIGCIVSCATITDIILHLKAIVMGQGVHEGFSKEKSTSRQLCRAFSAYHNSSILLSTSTPPNHLGAVHGIKFLSLTWVMLGHVYYCKDYLSLAGLTKIRDLGSNLAFQVVLNSAFAADTFFCLSGLLVVYTTLHQMEKRNGNFTLVSFYIRRYCRLTPAFLMASGLVLLGPLTGSGPIWNETLQPFVSGCQNYWWTNLFYFSNFIPTAETCVPHGWYLSCELQFYVLSPIIFLSLHRRPKLGLLLLVIGIVISMSAVGILTYILDLSPVSLFSLPDPKDIHEYLDTVGYKPYTHYASYCVGMAAGYLLVTNQKLQIKRVPQVFGWCAAIIGCTSVVYGTWEWNSGNLPYWSAAVAYASSCRTVWAFGIAWLIVMCTVGHGGIINTFLSWSGFVPLSRLTYVAYLIHPLLMYVYASYVRTPLYFSQYVVVYLYFGHLCVTFGLALILSLAFEMPFLNLERIISQKLDQQRKRRRASFSNIPGNWQHPEHPEIKDAVVLMRRRNESFYS